MCCGGCRRYSPRPALSNSAGEPTGALADAINATSDPPARAAVVKSPEGFDLLPGNIDLTAAEIRLMDEIGREQRLKEALAEVADRYDTILLDCPPALGLLTINAMVAAHSVLIPVQCEYYAMEGLGRLMESIERMRQSLNPSLEIEGIVLTMYDARNSLARQVVEQIRGHFGEAVYQTMIPRNVTLAEAPSYGRPALLYNMASSGAQAYLSLAKEFVVHGEKSPR